MHLKLLNSCCKARLLNRFSKSVILFATILLVPVFTLHSASIAAAVVPVTTPQQQTTNFIVLTSDKVEINARNMMLGEVLAEVQLQSNIQFLSSKELLTHRINKTVKDTTWSRAVVKLLRDFNIAATWDGDQIVKAIVLSSSNKEYEPEQTEQQSNQLADGRKSDVIQVEPVVALLDPTIVDPFDSTIAPPGLEAGVEREYEYLPPPDDANTGEIEEILWEDQEDEINSLVEIDLPDLVYPTDDGGTNRSIVSLPPSIDPAPPSPTN